MYSRHVRIKVCFYCDFALPVECVAAQEHFWRVSQNSSELLSLISFLHLANFLMKTYTVLITNHATVVWEGIQVGMKHGHL
jgi:hypothetical protein